jgi:DNA topoisomerase-1
VNDYIQAIIGETFTAKDFRTWAGTLLCSIALAIEGQGKTRTERKRKIRRAIQATAEQLGNTPAVCRSSYICPRILEEYEGRPFDCSARPPRKTGGAPGPLDGGALAAEVPASDDRRPPIATAGGVIRRF